MYFRVAIFGDVYNAKPLVSENSDAIRTIEIRYTSLQIPDSEDNIVSTNTEPGIVGDTGKEWVSQKSRKVEAQFRIRFGGMVESVGSLQSAGGHLRTAFGTERPRDLLLRQGPRRAIADRDRAILMPYLLHS
jgi:hypothetical protein